MLAAILICGTMNMLIACTEQSDNPVSPDAGETFSIVTLNVDGLPAYIDATLIGMGVMPLNVIPWDMFARTAGLHLATIHLSVLFSAS